MNVLSGVVILVVLVTGAVLLASRRRASVLEPPVPEQAEHWLIAHTARHPRLQRILRSTDRRVVGGCVVAVSLAALGAAAIAVGWILDTVDTSRGFARWDRSVAQWGADNATPFTTDVLGAITHLGDTIVVVALLVAVAVFDYRRHHRHAVFGFVATIAIGVTALNNSLKWLVDRDRPNIAQLIGSAGSSFPSGHSATAAAGWAAILLVLERSSPRGARRWLMAGAVTVAVAVAASRALLGVHWLTDVIAGAIVGWTWFFLVAVVFGGRILRFGDPAARSAASGDVSSHAQGEPRGQGTADITAQATAAQTTRRGIETGFDT